MMLPTKPRFFSVTDLGFVGNKTGNGLLFSFGFGLGMFAPKASYAVGLSRNQKWGLVLPRNARAYRLTHEAVTGVRFPGHTRFRRFAVWAINFTETTLQGALLPVLSDARRSQMHAVSACPKARSRAARNFGIALARSTVRDFDMSGWVSQCQKTCEPAKQR